MNTFLWTQILCLIVAVVVSVYIYIKKKKTWILDSMHIIPLDSFGDYIYCRKELSYLLGRVSSYNEGRETIRLGTRYRTRRIYG